MARSKFSILACALAMAGCLDPAQARIEEAPQAPETGMVLPFGLLGCEYMLAQVPVPIARVDPYLPPGFHAAPRLLPPAAPATANPLTVVGFETDICESAIGLDANVTNAPYVAIWVPVVPPDEVNAPPGLAAFVAWDYLDPDPARRALLSGLGYPAFDGTVKTTSLFAGSTVTRTRDVELVGAGTFRLDAAGRPPATASFGGDLISYTPAADGRLSIWQWTWHATSGQNVVAGTLHVDPDHWTAAMLGSPVVPATYGWGRWDYTNGTIQLPPATTA